MTDEEQENVEMEQEPMEQLNEVAETLDMLHDRVNEVRNAGREIENNMVQRLQEVDGDEELEQRCVDLAQSAQNLRRRVEEGDMVVLKGNL